MSSYELIETENLRLLGRLLRQPEAFVAHIRKWVPQIVSYEYVLKET